MMTTMTTPSITAPRLLHGPGACYIDVQWETLRIRVTRQWVAQEDGGDWAIDLNIATQYLDATTVDGPAAAFGSLYQVALQVADTLRVEARALPRPA